MLEWCDDRPRRTVSGRTLLYSLLLRDGQPIPHGENVARDGFEYVAVFDDAVKFAERKVALELRYA